MTIYDLAEKLHAKLCHINHTDGCGWYYETGKSYPTPVWEAWAHKRFLDQAKKIRDMSGLELEDIARVVDAL